MFTLSSQKRLELSALAGLFIALMLAAVSSFELSETSRSSITSSVIRLHILADSDSDEDQRLKLIVRDAVLSQYGEALSQADGKGSGVDIISRSLEGIKDTAEDALRANGCGDSVSCELTDMFFAPRSYDGFTMPMGTYTALRISIGSAQGKNWWCVMYPPLCLPAASEIDEELTECFTASELEMLQNPEKYEIRFKCAELCERYVAHIEKRGNLCPEKVSNIRTNCKQIYLSVEKDA